MRRAWHWSARLLATVAVACFGVVFVADTLGGWPGGIWQVVAVAANTLVGLVYIGVGMLLVERRPGNPVGPLLLFVGVAWAIAGPLDLYLGRGIEEPWSPHAALLLTSIGYPINVALAIALILFPDGSPPSRRWWAIIAIIVAGGMAGVIAIAFGPSTLAPSYPSVVSPFAIPAFPKRALSEVADTSMAMATLAGIVAIAMRWRRGDQVIRAQTTWVLGAVVVTFLTSRLAVQLDLADPFSAWLISLVQNTSVCLVPIAMAIAILRYRLYEIDRIVSRTIGYGVVTGVLFGVFFVVNVGLQRILGGVLGASPVAVAASTLVVAALFQPLRARVQRVVDRRFHRAHYDAERTVAGFASRLRDQLDMPTLTGELRRTTVEAVDPGVASVWLRSARGSR